MKVIFINIDHKFLTTSSFFLTKIFYNLKDNILTVKELILLSLLQKKKAFCPIKNIDFIKVAKNKKEESVLESLLRYLFYFVLEYLAATCSNSAYQSAPNFRIRASFTNL